MSDEQPAEDETEEAAAESEDTQEVAANAKLFGKWDVAEIHYEDPSTRRYLAVTPVAHTMGRHAQKQFKKSEISIVERLANRLMKTGANAGKKQQALKIVRDAFDIVHERTDENPIQVLVSAVENAAPREETVRLKYGGISVPQAVDTAPQRRVDQALKFLADGAHSASFKTPTDAAEALANQLAGAADYNVQTYAIGQKKEKERVAAAAR
ncbi:MULTISPECIES: 30S ribosomal protein S7 [Halobacterium]|uniref:Small ribosomal subunit protein uS7 n=5 Tax=Halobacterium salinarum TaxID=2242 RepID=RS7_HALSA|nr:MULTISPECIES: 30S ribosomal protein S7 [Halobacterium]B0R8D0.1 RecName: Full=Small ribosomal subunit protein uS7; AltName: Full=30S ribosomal protein S7 [Halobacterium salinarum R1]P0CX01.1 RecName: Full=Small ribosomal subunit protein uS7; AltName: Full=30S ribosomal protein S7 [Halobacterium salinarum NRC-1]AAG20688.1 30S ribosomal protein S7P [Halobacterium salinarum NRC-1]MBB6089372.1 small subunit ribosomal protein S7 [Halobacterium salinarum]MCF2164641.1 30S ribosomal protein S7 [Halo